MCNRFSPSKCCQLSYMGFVMRLVFVHNHNNLHLTLQFEFLICIPCMHFWQILYVTLGGRGGVYVSLATFYPTTLVKCIQIRVGYIRWGHWTCWWYDCIASLLGCTNLPACLRRRCQCNTKWIMTRFLCTCLYRNLKTRRAAIAYK